MSKRTLYLFASLASVVGLSWVLFNVLAPEGAHTPDLCPFRNVTGLPCPSCGSTHAVLKLLNLDWKGALYDNPLGYVVAAALAVLPAWILYDLVLRKSSFYSFYTRSEAVIRKRWVAVTLILLVTVNWIWSIYKYTL